MASRLKSIFRNAVAAAALGLNLPTMTLTKKPTHIVTQKAGKRGAPYRRIIRHEVIGPLFRQVGIKWQHGEAVPLMQTFTTHRFLHATKGWREYTNRLPMQAAKKHRGIYA